MIGWLLWPLGSIAVWLPWLWWATGRLMVRPGPGRVALLAFIVTLSILAGHPETSYHVALSTGLFAVFYAVFALPASVKQVAVRLGLWGGAYALGSLLSAVQLFPFVEYFRESQVLASRGTAGSMHAALDLPYMCTLFSPDLFGNSVHNNDWRPGQ